MSPRCKRGLRGGEIGFGKVALAAVGHGELGVGLRRFRLALRARAQQRDRLVGIRLVVGGDQRLASMIWISVAIRRELRRRWRSGAIASAGCRLRAGLALQLVEIGIVRLRLDQRVDLRRCAPRRARMPIGRDGARIARRQAGVARRIAPRDRVRPLDEAGRAWRASGRGAAAIRAGPSCPNRGSSWPARRARRRARPASDATACRDRRSAPRTACWSARRLKVSYIPFADWPVAVRNLTPARSAAPPGRAR